RRLDSRPSRRPDARRPPEFRTQRQPVGRADENAATQLEAALRKRPIAASRRAVQRAGGMDHRGADAGEWPDAGTDVAKCVMDSCCTGDKRSVGGQITRVAMV